MVVCHCHRVSDARVENALAAGASGLRGVVRATAAGTGCGGCLPTLRALCEQAATLQADHVCGEVALAG